MAQQAFEFNGVDITGTSGTTITLPSATDTIVGRATTDTLTNKTISGANNTITVRLANDVTGTLPIANGGTGQTTANAALNAFLPSQASNSGKYLTTDGTNTSWGTVSGYSAPTLGTTSIASGATVSNVNGLTINSTTIPSSVTLVSTAATQTLTNKTISGPTLILRNGVASTSNAATGDIAISSSGDLSYTAGNIVYGAVSIPWRTETLSNKTIVSPVLNLRNTTTTSNATTGDIVYNPGVGVIQFSTGNTVKTVVDTDTTQTLSNKTLSSPNLTNTLSLNGSTGSAGQVVGITQAGPLGWVTAGASTADSYTRGTVFGKDNLNNNVSGFGYGVFGGVNYNGYGTTAVGVNAMGNAGQWQGQQKPSECLAIGHSSLNSFSMTGSYNIGIGSYSAGSITSGSYNTIIGYYAGTTFAAIGVTSGSNNTLIGNEAMPASDTASNAVTLGNSSITSLRCAVTTITSVSDARDKTDIEDLSVGLDFVNKLRPVKFTWNTRQPENPILDEEGNPRVFGKVGIKDSGFIAQELIAAEDEEGLADWLQLTLRENPDRLEASPGRLVPVLVKAVQELSAKVAELEARLN